MFTAREVKDRLRQQPFKPLRIVTSSGESYEVMHPDLVFVGARELIVGIPSRKDPTIFDGTHRVSMLHITALEELPPRTAKKKSSKGNGKNGN